MSFHIIFFYFLIKTKKKVIFEKVQIKNVWKALNQVDLTKIKYYFYKYLIASLDTRVINVGILFIYFVFTLFLATVRLMIEIFRRLTRFRRRHVFREVERTINTVTDVERRRFHRVCGYNIIATRKNNNYKERIQTAVFVGTAHPERGIKTWSV